MASIINASTSGAGGLISTADNSGTLQLQTAGTTAMTINSSQVVNFANSFTVGGSPLPSSPMTLISTQKVNNVSNIAFTGLSGYDKYFVIVESVIPNNAGSNLQITLGYGSTTYLSSGYVYSGYYGGSSSGNVNATSGSYFKIVNNAATGASYSNNNLSANFYITGANPSSSSGKYWTINSSGNLISPTENISVSDFIVGNIANSSNSLTAINITVAPGGVYTNATASVYGITS